MAVAILRPVLWPLLRALVLPWLLLVAPAQASSQAASQTQVSVDWTLVLDADVQRCKLGRLRAGTIERLVDDGHAVVDSVGAQGISVEVASTDAGMRVQVHSAGAVRVEVLEVGPDCDVTLVLALISRIAELVQEVVRERPPAAAAPPTALAVAPAPPQPPPPGLTASLDLAARASYTPSILAGLGLGLRFALGPSLELGVRAELLGNVRHGVTVLEGFVGAACVLWPDGLPGLVLELGPMLHSGASAQRSLRGVDLGVAVGAHLSLGHLDGQLLLQARLRRFEHRIGDKTALDTGYLGVVFRIGGQLFGA